MLADALNGCFQSVKVKKFESNSQRLTLCLMTAHGCFQSVKVKKFESNSQLHGNILAFR